MIRQHLSELWLRIRGSLNRKAISQEMEREFQFHIEQATARNIARGMSPEDARTHALRTFGGVSFHQDEGADEQRSRWLEDLFSDIRYAARTLRRNPRFALATGLTIAVSIAANTAIFSVVNGVLLRPLPFPGSDQLSYIGWDYGTGLRTPALTQFQVEYLRTHNAAFEGVTTYRAGERAIGDADAFETARTLHVSREFFRVAQILPVQGRAFDSTEYNADAEDVALLGNAFWRTRFGSKDDVVGQSLRLDGKSYRIVGVMPPHFRMPDEAAAPDVIIPLALDTKPSDGGHNFRVMARRHNDAGPTTAANDLASVSKRFAEEYPKFVAPPANTSMISAPGFFPQRFQDVIAGDIQRTLWILLGAVVFVALIAAANVANLFLVRASARQRELAARTTLGASRGRIVRQLLAESLLLSTISGAVGVVAGLWSVSALLALAPAELPRAQEIGFDWRVALFTGGLSLITGLVLGAISALAGTRASVIGLLGRASRGGTPAGGRFRESLIVAETGIAVVLLVGAGLLLTSFSRLRSVDPGFDATNVTTARFTRMPVVYREDGRLWDFENRMLSQIRARPGIDAAAAVSSFPLQRGFNFPVTPEGRPEAALGSAEWRLVSDGYFETLRIPITRGRAFNDGDVGTSPRVVIVNASMAARFWPNEDPIGKRLEIGRWKGDWLNKGFEGAAEVVGVVADIREAKLADGARTTLYTPRAQWSGMLNSPKLVIRASNAESVAPIVESTVHTLDSRVKPPVFTPLESIVGASIAEQRFQTVLIAAFAMLALLLTAIGIYGVIASTVSYRVREIGIRIALGARASRVVRAMAARGARLLFGGIVLGVIGAMALTRLLKGRLFDVTPTDPTTIALAVSVLTVVGLVATWIPAHRASRVEPTEALRAE